MSNYKFLNLPIPLLRDGITVETLPKSRIAKLDLSLINPKLLNFFSDHNLMIVYAETFFKKAGSPSIIHTDVLGGDYIKINWIYETGSSKMAWYNTKSTDIKAPSITLAGDQYLSYSIHEVTFVESTELRNPTIIQAGIPHNVINITGDRLCISLVLTNKLTDERVTMAEISNILSEYII